MYAEIDHLKIPQSETLILYSHDCDTSTYRTDGEPYYSDSLVTISLRRVAQESDCFWRDHITIDYEAMLWNGDILPDNFRHVKRDSIPVFKYNVRFGSRIRSEKGYFLTCQVIEAKEIALAYYAV